MSRPGGRQTPCLYDADLSGGEVRLSCHRMSLPGRWLCHKHAGMKNQRLRRRAKNKVARATRQGARRK